MLSGSLKECPLEGKEQRKAGLALQRGQMHEIVEVLHDCVPISFNIVIIS